MSMNRRQFATLVGAGTLGAVCTWSHAVAQDASPAVGQGGTLMYGKPEEAVGWDPALVTAGSSFELIAAVYENLLIFDDNGEAVGVLAEKWDIVDDKTYVFTLREGVMFHNGQPLTAADVKFTYDRIKDEAMASPWTSQFAPVESIEATDDKTVTFKLNQSYGPFLATLSSSYAGILPNLPDTDFQSEMIGTGAFKIDKAEKDVQTTLVANTEYWRDGQPVLGQLDYKILPDESARLAAVRTGEVHLTQLADPISIDTARADDNVVVIDQETTDYYLLGLNCKEAPFDDVNVRQALSLAIDRQAIIDNVFFGQGQVSGPIVPTLGDWASPAAELPNYTYDPDAAKALLEEAGQSDLTFKITLGANHVEFVNAALVIQDQLKQIGVMAELDQVEWGTFIEKWKARDFQSFISYNGSGNDPDRALYPALYTDGSVNAFQFSDTEIDKLLDDARAETDTETRKSIYNKLEQKIAEAAPLIFLCTRFKTFVTTPSVHGFAPSPSQTWLTLPETSIGN